MALINKKKRIEEQENELEEELEEFREILPQEEEIPYILSEMPEAIRVEKKSRIIPFLIVFVVFAVFAGGIFALIHFKIVDISGLTLSNLRAKVPIANNIVIPSEANAKKSADAEKLTEEIAYLEERLKEREAEIENLKEQNNIYAKEVIRLQEFEETQMEFKAMREEFENMIASEAPKAFEKFYAEMSPENAEKIYRELSAQTVSDKRFKRYINTFQNMDDTAIGKMFQSMIDTDLDLVVSILESLPIEQAASIISAMEPADGAVIAKRMYPE